MGRGGDGHACAPKTSTNEKQAQRHQHDTTRHDTTRQKQQLQREYRGTIIATMTKTTGKNNKTA